MKKKGFTIIEVSLVLAIAGLIFLMVFIALPALQRSARDTQRREDMLNLISQIKKYQSNNRGTLPTGSGKISFDAGAAEKASWAGFYKNYLGENFKDPSGGVNYVLSVSDCSGENCSGLSAASFPNEYQVIIKKGATCSGETASKVANPRKLAVLYKLEGGGIFCENT